MTTTDRTRPHPARKGLKSTAIGIVVNALLAIGKGVAGFIGNSYALIADAIESTSDVLSSFIVLIGLKIASKPRDENHPYGHVKPNRWPRSSSLWLLWERPSSLHCRVFTKSLLHITPLNHLR